MSLRCSGLLGFTGLPVVAAKDINMMCNSNSLEFRSVGLCVEDRQLNTI